MESCTLFSNVTTVTSMGSPSPWPHADHHSDGETFSRAPEQPAVFHVCICAYLNLKVRLRSEGEYGHVGSTPDLLGGLGLIAGTCSQSDQSGSVCLCACFNL